MKTSFLKNFYLRINDSFLRVLKQILHTVCWMNILEKDVFWGVGFFKNEKKMEAFLWRTRELIRLPAKKFIWSLILWCNYQRYLKIVCINRLFLGFIFALQEKKIFHELFWLCDFAEVDLYVWGFVLRSPWIELEVVWRRAVRTKITGKGVIARERKQFLRDGAFSCWWWQYIETYLSLLSVNSLQVSCDILKRHWRIVERIYGCL